MKKEHAEKSQKARAEARPKKLLEVLGWEVSADERNYIIRKDNKTYYFGTFLVALECIARNEDKKVTGVLEDAVKEIKASNEALVKALRTLLQTRSDVLKR